MESFVICPEGNYLATFVVNEREIKLLRNYLSTGGPSGTEERGRFVSTFINNLEDAIAKFQNMRNLEMTTAPPFDPQINSFTDTPDLLYDEDVDEEYYEDDEDESEEY